MSFNTALFTVNWAAQMISCLACLEPSPSTSSSPIADHARFPMSALRHRTSSDSSVPGLITANSLDTDRGCLSVDLTEGHPSVKEGQNYLVSLWPFSSTRRYHHDLKLTKRIPIRFIFLWLDFQIQEA